MKKTWFVKYLITALVSLSVMILIYIYMPKNTVNSNGEVTAYGWPWWLPILVPYLSLSVLAVWKIIKRYCIFCFENISTGNQVYNTLFKVLLTFCGILILPFLLAVGFPMVFVEFFRDLSIWKMEHPPKKKKKPQKTQVKDAKMLKQPRKSAVKRQQAM